MRKVFSFFNSHIHIIIIGILLVILVSLTIYFIIPFPSNYLEPSKYSVKIFDRNKRLIVELNQNGGLNERFYLKDVPDTFINLLLLSEDRNFFHHFGVDFKALGRVITEFFKSGKFSSGGSTISMQLVKLKKGITKNTFFTKIFEIIDAIKLELHFSKEEIIESYLNEVYLGNNIYGFQKASKLYFGKPLINLNIAEMGFLIKIINYPSDIYFRKHSILSKVSNFITLAYRKGIINENQYLSGLSYKVEINPIILPFSAPHFCFFVVNEAKKFANGEIEEIYTTIDIDLYYDVLNIARNVVDNFAKYNLSQAGILIVDNETMEIICMIGSVNYFSEYGANNGVLVKRQPGSTMKPFTYALGFEKSIINTSSILPDIETSFPIRYGKYIPRNYDNKFHGPVRVAEALGNSYNIPAVYLLSKIGVDTYFSLLKTLKFTSLKKPPEFYGLGITLGNGDITLLELVRAYTVFPNNGFIRDLKSVRFIKLRGGKIVYPPNIFAKKVLSEETCFLINHILSNHKYRVKAFGVNSAINFPFKVAVKTGTSKDFRDNTIVAYNKKLTIGVWAGDFSGKSMINIPSAKGAGIIVRDVILHLYNKGIWKNEDFYKPNSITEVEICKLSGLRASKWCNDKNIEFFVKDKEPKEECNWHRNGKIYIPSDYKNWAYDNLPRNKISLTEDKLKIIFPHNGSVFAIDKSVKEEIQKISLEANVNNRNVQWFVNGEFLGRGNPILFQLKEGTFYIEARYKSQVSRVKIIIVERM